MPKVVINTCYGGFRASRRAHERHAELIGKKLFVIPDPKYKAYIEYYSFEDLTYEEFVKDMKAYELDLNVMDRSNPLLVQVVEELGSGASVKTSDLEIVEIPDDVDWEIQEYDGKEWVSEKHRTWR